MCRRVFKYQTTESGDIPFFKIGSFGATPDAFIPKDLFEKLKMKYPYPEKGDVLISASGSIGRTVVFTGKDEYFQDSNIVWLKHDNSIINHFLKYLYSIVKWVGIEGTTIKRLYNDNILKTEVIIPTLSEQQKVSNYLDGLDHLITLHQSKSFGHILKAIVSCTLSWEQRKTSELFKITRGYVLAANITDGNKSGDNPYPVYSSQTKDNGLMGYYKDYLYENAITWTTDGANAGTVNYRDEKFYCTNVCGVLLGDKVTPNQMLAEAINNVAKSYVSYVGNPKLMNNVMAEICIWLPSEDTERKAISSFVYSLDYLITLHQLEPFQLIFKAIAYRIIDYTKSKPPSHRK